MTTLIPVVDRLRSRFGVRRVCIVADRGMISKETIEELEKEERGWQYILGARMRSQNEVKDEVLSRAGRYRVVVYSALRRGTFVSRFATIIDRINADVPRESAAIRTVARIGDIYLMNNMFMLSPQSRAATRNQGIVDLLADRDLLTGTTLLELHQVRLVDLDAVRFLAAAERGGVELRHVPPFVRAWIQLERPNLSDLE